MEQGSKREKPANTGMVRIHRKARGGVAGGKKKKKPGEMGVLEPRGH